MRQCLPFSFFSLLAGMWATSALLLNSGQKGLHFFTAQPWPLFLAASLLTAITAISLSAVLSRRLVKPIIDWQDGIAKFTEQNFQVPLHLADQELSFLEAYRFAKAIDDLTAKVSKRVVSAEQQSGEVKALFANMVEAVMAIDAGGKLLSINLAAAELLNITLENAQGKSFLELVRNMDLHQIFKDTLASHGPIEGEILLMKQDELIYLQVHSVLVQHIGDQPGVLIVLNDITHLRRLENVRKDFVANVSHELKTPITTIKGFVETLRDGAIADPQDANRFLDIILKHADRLNAIVEDLLTLSRIEQEDKNAEIVLIESEIRGSLLNAIEACAAKAAEKDIQISLDCPDDLQATLNSPLLEQAITNLIVNAIKYSENSRRIEVNAMTDEGWVKITVRDFGVGIAEKHLPRLFERFYRSDKARSRKLGGTGLGLAIVKHIAQAHHGEVAVDSSVGRGSAFTIKLPSKK